MTGRNMKRISVNAFVAIMGFLAAMLVLEVATRVFHPSPQVEQYRNNVSDPLLPFKPKPLSVTSGRSFSDEFDYHYRHNSFGFRDVEHTHIKGENVYRILGLGDSFTYGVGADFEETYLYRLEVMLNGRVGEHPIVEIIKAGIPRYYSETELTLMQEYGLEYSPDLILVGFLPNDVIGTYFGLDAVVLDKSGYLKTRIAVELGQFGVWLNENSHALRILLRRFTALRMEQRYEPRREDVYVENGFHEDDWRRVENDYEKMVSIAGQIEADMVVVHIPQRGPWNESHYYPPKRLANWATEHGAGFVDVLPAMLRASGGQRLYYEQDGHATPAGYAIIANEIYDYLTLSEIVP